MSTQEDRIKDLEEHKESMIKFETGTSIHIKNIFRLIHDIKTNHLKHIDMKINALLFSVLGSLIIAGIFALIKYIRS